MKRLLPRVFFDSNAGSRAGYYLWFDRSREELAGIPDLAEGRVVLLYMPDELEVEARLTYDGTYWIGIPDENTWRVIDGSEEDLR